MPVSYKIFVLCKDKTWIQYLLIAIFQGNAAALSSYENIVEDICWLVSSFLFSDFIHVRRSGNLVVDTLAKKAKNMVGCQIWLEAMPEDIVPLVGLMFINFFSSIYAQTHCLVSQKKYLLPHSL